MHMKFWLLFIAGIGLATSAHAQTYPAPIQALVDKGIVIKAPMSAPPGFKGYIGEYRGQPVPLYLLPDGKHVSIGSLYGPGAEDLTQNAFREAVAPTLGANTWKALQQSTWIAEGTKKPERVIYVFTDSECPYCHKLWLATQPYLKQGKIQIRNVMVAVIKPQSIGRGAAILSAKDPVATLRRHEESFGHSSVKVLSPVPKALADKLGDNGDLMHQLGVVGTPAVVYRDRAGHVKIAPGLPPADAMDAIFGKPSP